MQLLRLNARLQALQERFYSRDCGLEQGHVLDSSVMSTIRLLLRSVYPKLKLAVHHMFVKFTMLQTLKSFTHVQRQACTRVSAYWGIAAACSQQQLRCLSSVERLSAGTAGTGEEAIMGVMGTSVTKKLWQERLTKNKDRLKHLPLPTPTPKLPQQTAVTYAFSSDRFLQEQASDRLNTSVNFAFLNVPESHSIETHGIKCVWESCLKTLTLWRATLLSSIGEPDLLCVVPSDTM